MNAVVHAILVLARRDFTATVVSRTFLLFLIAPLFPLLFGLVFGAVGSKVSQTSGPAHVVVIADTGTNAAMIEAHQRLSEISGAGSQINLEASPGGQDGEARGRALLAGPKPPAAVLVISGEKARLFGSAASLSSLGPPLNYLLSQARRTASASAPSSLAAQNDVVLIPTGTPARAPARDLTGLAQGAQTLLFVLTLMLAGVLISNFVEEKANKVIEVLAAATPVPAIFLGKLLAMLGSSLVGVTVWGATAALGLVLLGPANGSLLPTPAIGWPLFAVLGLAYFAMNYLLVGALLLGIGAQAASIRQIQTLSLPITMAQLLLYGLAASAIGNPDSPIALSSAVFPFSSPLAMIARAAALPALWPHAVALLWQALWVSITIFAMARLFRRGVLKSGPARRKTKKLAA